MQDEAWFFFRHQLISRVDARRFIAKAANARGEVGVASYGFVQPFHELRHDWLRPKWLKPVLDFRENRAPPTVLNSDIDDMHFLQCGPENAGAKFGALLREVCEGFVRWHPVCGNEDRDIRHWRYRAFSTVALPSCVNCAVIGV